MDGKHRHKRRILADAPQYPEVLPIVREAIKWRYEYLPFLYGSSTLSQNADGTSNSLMWDSHINANPTNAWLGWGGFATDPVLFSPEILDGFDSWLGAGQMLSTPALFEGMLSREVYFPKSLPEDGSLYFDLYAPYKTYVAGSRATVSTPLEHMGLFARERAVIPIGKPQATVTQTSGPARTTGDGVDVVLESEGGVVGLDDWRGVQIFPGQSGTYSGSWIEDDGISAEPARSVIEVIYLAGKEEVEVTATFLEKEFKPLWGRTVHVLLPFGDRRKVKGAEETTGRDRAAWVIQVS